MSAIIDAVYSNEYDVTLEKMNGYRLIDYYLEKGYSVHISQKLVREWEKEGIK